jgi:hypothetical protein
LFDSKFVDVVVAVDVANYRLSHARCTRKEARPRAGVHLKKFQTINVSQHITTLVTTIHHAYQTHEKDAKCERVR